MNILYKIATVSLFAFVLMGSTAFAVTETYLDDFNGGTDYSNSAGTIDWSSTLWQEVNDDDSAAGGRISIVNSQLRFNNLDTASISRKLNLSNAVSVELTLDWDVSNNGDEDLRVELWDDTNSVWNLVDIIDDTGNPTGSISYILTSDEMSLNSEIRFITNTGRWNSTETILVDNVLFTIFPDTDGDGVADNIDIDDDNDGILDVYEGTTVVDNYSGGDGGSTHTFTYHYLDYTNVIIDLMPIDNSFNIEIDGQTILEDGRYLDLQEPSDTLGSRLIFADNSTMVQPWVANTNGLPRVKVTINELGTVVVYGTRDISSTVLEIMHTEDGALYNSLYFPAGDRDITVINPDGPGPDAITGINTVVTNIDTDGDGIQDKFDLDSDNDGIPDNVEAQPTIGYIPPAPFTDANGNGLDDKYESGQGGTDLTSPDTDGDGIPDFLDSDSDNDGYSDCEEGYTTGPETDCPVTTVQANGLVDWAGLSDYSQPNGYVVDPSNDLYDETTDTNDVGYREFLCGKALITLTHRNWRLISVPCDTGIYGVEELFEDSLGPYGQPSQGGRWIMEEQSGSDNYEVNATHPNTDKIRLDENSTLKQGQSYWIIIDTDDITGLEKNVTIPRDLSDLSPTVRSDSSAYNPNAAESHLYILPKSSAANVKKFMAGNPFPYAFKLTDLFFDHTPNGFKPMGDTDLDLYINSTVYKHDDPQTGPVDGYEALDAATPGFNGEILPMEGFFIKLEQNSDESNLNVFSYPLIMK